MKDLVNFILKSCGCTNFVSNYDIEDTDSAANILSTIQEEFANQPQPSADYPIISKRPEFKKLRNQISTFFTSLIAHIEANGMLYQETHPIEALQIWTTAMSSSTLRAFRHTSTFISLGIVTNLSEIAADQRRMNVTTQKQLDAENGKARKNQGRITSLTQKVKEAGEKISAVESVIKDIFESVFVHRYRDVDSKIRTECVRDLGLWIQRLPDVFFDTQYLRYLGWVLSDVSATTRLEVVRALGRLYHNKENASGLRSFTERFRPRLIEMATLDADSHVRVATIDVLEGIREIGYLEPDDIDTVGKLLFDSDHRVRAAASTFFAKSVTDLYEEKAEDLGGSEAVDEFSAEEDDESDEPKLDWLKLKCLLEILAGYDRTDEDESESQGVQSGDDVGTSGIKLAGWDSRFSLAGEVLWEDVPGVQEWEEIAKYLTYDHSAAQDADVEDGTIKEKLARAVALDPKEEAILLQVLNTSISQSTKIVDADATDRKKKAQAQEHRDAISRSLIKIIPNLLKKFGPVPDSAAAVLRLPQQLNFSIYSELRQEKQFATLLDDINRQFLNHADESVLKEASVALLHAKKFEDLSDTTDRKISSLYEETITTLMETVRGKNASSAKFSDASLTELINSVRRLDYLSSVHSSIDLLESPPPGVTEKNRTPLEILTSLLLRSSTTDELEEELIVRTMKVLLFYFMWKVKALGSIDPSELADTDVDEVQDRRTEILAGLQKVLDSHASNPLHPVYHAAVLTLLDLYILFNTLLTKFPAPATDDIEDPSPVTRMQQLFPPFSESQTDTILTAFAHHERSFADTLNKRLLPSPPIPYPEPLEDTPSDDEDESTDPATRLAKEQALCELTAKIVLAILGGVIDLNPTKARLAYNKTILGSAFRDVLTYLEGPPVHKKRAPKKKKVELATDLLKELELDDVDDERVEEMDRELEALEKEMETSDEEEGGEEPEGEGEGEKGDEDVEMEDA